MDSKIQLGPIFSFFLLKTIWKPKHNLDYFCKWLRYTKNFFLSANFDLISQKTNLSSLWNGFLPLEAENDDVFHASFVINMWEFQHWRKIIWIDNDYIGMLEYIFLTLVPLGVLLKMQNLPHIYSSLQLENDHVFVCLLMFHTYIHKYLVFG